MHPDLVTVIVEIAIGVLTVPWCTWVTTSIFGLRTQTAIMQEQLKSIKNIEALVVKQLGAHKDGYRA